MSDFDSDYQIIHHVVYSVKGGCGKTSFSLRLLLTDFLREDQECRFNRPRHENETRPVVNYLFDMDFLGTSLLNLCGKSKYIKLNDLIFNEADVRDLDSDDYDNRIEVEDMHYGDAKYIIPSSQHETDKERFHVKRKNNPLLRYDDFRHDIAGIIEKIELTEKAKSATGERSEPFDINFIYDMPPNADGYTEAFFDYVINCSQKGEKVFLYLVYNNDSTLTCDVEWLASFMASGRLLKNIHLYFVSNEIIDQNKTGSGDNSVASFEERRLTIKGTLMTFNLDIEYDYAENSFTNSIMDFNYDIVDSELKRRLELKDLYYEIRPSYKSVKTGQ